MLLLLIQVCVAKYCDQQGHPCVSAVPCIQTPDTPSPTALDSAFANPGSGVSSSSSSTIWIVVIILIFVVCLVLMCLFCYRRRQRRLKKSVHPALLKARDELKAKQDFMVEDAAGHVKTSGGVAVKIDSVAHVTESAISQHSLQIDASPVEEAAPIVSVSAAVVASLESLPPLSCSARTLAPINRIQTKVLVVFIVYLFYLVVVVVVCLFLLFRYLYLSVIYC